jgi:transcriptional regulator with XRE-family HTH domain
MLAVPNSSFGARLRLARAERGLSQSALGGEIYSGSYISHLESGRRQPTSEVVEHLAGRLGLDPSWFRANQDERSRASHKDAELAALELRVHNGVMTRDYGSVIEEVDLAGFSEEDNPSAWWAITWSKAESQLALAVYDSCRDTAIELASSRLANVLPELKAAALALASRAERAAGHLESSLVYAENAVQADSTPASTRAVSLRELVASLAELGRIDEAAKAAAELESIRGEIADTQLLGLIAWTVGNVAFLTGNRARGVSEHEAASNLLRPEADLRLWGRFHKASAAMRLHSGSFEGVDLSISRATMGLDLAGNTSDHAELHLLRAERALIDDPDGALQLVLEGLGATVLPMQTHAEGLVIQARALDSLGRAKEAKRALTEAAAAFDSVGAHRRSADIWRELASRG